MTKWHGGRRRLLTPNEFQQMAGRAGRRGTDERGNVVVPYSPGISFEKVLAVATGELEPVRSAFTIRYYTVLKLWDPPSGDRVRQLFQESLAQYQAAQRVRLLEKKIRQVGHELETVPRGCLLGLDGDDLLYDYRNIVAQLDRAKSQEQQPKRVLAQLEAALNVPPWAVPSQSALRRLIREEERLQTIQQTLHELAQQCFSHPCHACQRRKEHQRNLQQIARLAQKRAALQAQLARERAAEERRVRELLRRICNVLEHFGYLDHGYPTDKADTLANVFDTNGLIICEMLDRDFFQGLEPADVAEVFSWFAFVRETRFANDFTLPTNLDCLRSRLESLEQEVFEVERRNGLALSTGHHEGFYGAMRAWCMGATLAEITEQIELSEGDLVFTFNKSLDLMRQVREMLETLYPYHPLCWSIATAEALARRDIIEQPLMIGLLPPIGT
jgi:superfamily II RNA helicase